MKKTKIYQRTRFSADILRESIVTFQRIIGDSGKTRFGMMKVNISETVSFYHDTLEEYLADYRESVGTHINVYGYESKRDYSHFSGLAFSMIGEGATDTEIDVEFPDRERIEKVFRVFDRASIESQLPEPEGQDISPVIFIGHGHSEAWRDLKDHLQDKHGYSVESYETGARAGHTIRDIIQEMISKSAFAVLVLTAEDTVDEEKYRARQNVIHETGLFQGCLGFSRAIVLLEDGVETFSNLDGIQYISFAKDNIRATFGDVLATIRREFGT